MHAGSCCSLALALTLTLALALALLGGGAVELEEEFRLLTLQIIGEAILSLAPEECDRVSKPAHVGGGWRCGRESPLPPCGLR
jgi:hypothetical protein